MDTTVNTTHGTEPDIPTVELHLVQQPPLQTLAVSECDQDSMELVRDKTGKYAWKLKMYFDGNDDKDETLCRLMKLNRQFYDNYAEHMGVK